MELIGISCHPSIDRDDEHPEEIMDPISGRSAYNVLASSANPAEAAQTAAGTHPSGHASKLTSAMLSHHTLAALNTKKTQGNEQEKTLAGFAKEAMRSGLKISPNQPANGIAQFGAQRGDDELLIQAKLNERSEYDVLSVESIRGSEAPVSMVLPGPSAAVAGTARHPSALLGLPNELLLQIAGSTGKRGEGVDLSLRGVNQHMKAIADDQLSPKQRFLAENGQNLHAAGYDRADINALARLTPAQQNFALTNGPALQATAGYNGHAISDLASFTPAQQNFALTNSPTLRATAGYDGYAINRLARRTPAQQNFALTNGQKLHATAGYNGHAIVVLAQLPPAVQNFALTNGPALHATAGYDGHAINDLAIFTPAQQNFALTNGPALHETADYDGHAINGVAASQR
ncbi:hypothetical protein [Pseudomonas sp. GL-B-16]|uniref:hypothetical protein n=1 Tax=Pseudomonas sp. GL-B-16 TaxID=2832373 RepID=UPI001CBFCDB8|nr:hypothetical protein [Pseudomonas sp. GL-B-16]